MKFSIEIKDKDILEAIAEKYPNAKISLEEVKDHLEAKFADVLTYDKDYEWHLTNDKYFQSLNELARDRQIDAEEAIAEVEERYLVSV